MYNRHDNIDNYIPYFDFLNLLIIFANLAAAQLLNHIKGGKKLPLVERLRNMLWWSILNYTSYTVP